MCWCCRMHVVSGWYLRRSLRTDVSNLQRLLCCGPVLAGWCELVHGMCCGTVWDDVGNDNCFVLWHVLIWTVLDVRVDRWGLWQHCPVWCGRERVLWLSSAVRPLRCRRCATCWLIVMVWSGTVLAVCKLQAAHCVPRARMAQARDWDRHRAVGRARQGSTHRQEHRRARLVQPDCMVRRRA